jgi:thiosulfate reductase cytochrome b subunit
MQIFLRTGSRHTSNSVLDFRLLRCCDRHTAAGPARTRHVRAVHAKPGWILLVENLDITCEFVAVVLQHLRRRLEPARRRHKAVRIRLIWVEDGLLNERLAHRGRAGEDAAVDT